MGAIDKVGTALTLVFAVALVALIVEILYVLWRRRLFPRRACLPSSGDVEISGSFHPPPSKELLYLFCWKNQTYSRRVEPDTDQETAPPNPTGPPPDAGASLESEVADDDDDVLKWHQMRGPSRVLYTIKEEAEKEDMEAAAEAIKSSPNLPIEGEVSDGEGDATPFSTPCASPPYYTPSPSPLAEDSFWQSSSSEPVVSADNRNIHQ